MRAFQWNDRPIKFGWRNSASTYTEARSVDIQKKLEPSSGLSRWEGAMHKSLRRAPCRTPVNFFLFNFPLSHTPGKETPEKMARFEDNLEKLFHYRAHINVSFTSNVTWPLSSCWHHLISSSNWALPPSHLKTHAILARDRQQAL
jgi:hypothetical protein